MGRCAEAEEAGDIKEQIRLALEWVNSSRERDQPRSILPPSAEEGTRREALARGRRLVEEVRKQCPEEEEDPEGGRQSKLKGLLSGRGGQMRYIPGDGDVGEHQSGGEGPAQGEERREPGQGADGRVEQEGDGEGVEEGEGAAEGGGRKSAAREGEEGQDSGGGAGEDREGRGGKPRGEEDEQEPPEGLQQGGDEDGRPKRKPARGVRYEEEPIGHRAEPETVVEGVTVYGPTKRVGSGGCMWGRWRS